MRTMNNAQAAVKSKCEKLANDVAKLLRSGLDDSILLKVGEMILSHVVDGKNPDLAYENYPTITQFVTEENDRRGTPYTFPDRQ